MNSNTSLKTLSDLVEVSQDYDTRKHDHKLPMRTVSFAVQQGPVYNLAV